MWPSGRWPSHHTGASSLGWERSGPVRPRTGRWGRGGRDSSGKAGEGTSPVCGHARGVMCRPGPQGSPAAGEGCRVATAELFGLNSLALGLGQPSVPGPFSQVGGAGWKGGGTSKGGCRRAPRCSLSSQQAPPPEPGASPVSRGGGQEHLALRTRGRKWGWQVGGAPPCIPTPTLGTALKAFLSGWLRAGGGWRGGRERHHWGPEEAELVPRAGSPSWAEGPSLSPKRQALLGP